MGEYCYQSGCMKVRPGSIVAAFLRGWRYKKRGSHFRAWYCPEHRTKARLEIRGTASDGLAEMARRMRTSRSQLDRLPRSRAKSRKEALGSGVSPPSEAVEVETIGHFRVTGFEIVEDLRTDLQWQRMEATTEMSYSDGSVYCRDLRLAGRTDWRLPSIEELYSLRDVRSGKCARVFPDLRPARYWSSTPFEEHPDTTAYTLDLDPEGNYRLAITYFKTYKYCIKAVCGQARAGSLPTRKRIYKDLSSHFFG